ncbi:MAG: thiazole synthase [Gemmatimonadetes bacterium]|nr:MAG: thiazole synthase [Gemmatimonadota bacterium]
MHREALVDGDGWTVAGVTLRSRFLLGSAGYPSPQVLREAMRASSTQVVTVGLKRTLASGSDNGFIAIVREALTEQDAIWPYCTDDLVTCRRLLDVGCPVLMPWGAPIGSGQGLANPLALRTLRARLPDTILIVDAGLGAPSHAARAMELGFDAVLVNSAVALSGDPVRMARAFGCAVQAGRDGWRAGLIPAQDFAVASTPVAGQPVLLGGAEPAGNG